MKKTAFILFFLYLYSVLFGAGELPVGKGFIVYHSYSSYDAWDSKMFLYNFEDSSLNEISENWNIDHAMNGHISPDGKKLVFMGDDKGEPRDWDIYIWNIGSEQPPVNLTHSFDKRDEDPKFSSDGNKIVFKQGYWNNVINDFSFDLKELNVAGDIINIITLKNSTEESMPFYTVDSKKVIYASDGGANGDIYVINTNGINNTVLVNESNIQEYYPIVRNSETFFYSRWVSSSDFHDQVYLGYFNGDPSISLPFNIVSADNSDAYPASTDFAFFSSTRNGGKGAYDLYLGNIFTGEVWNLDLLANINTVNNELGICYNENIPQFTSSKMTDDSEKINVYPNPCNNGIFHLTTDKNYLLRVIDINGKIILTQNIQYSNIVDISNYGSGIYYLLLHSESEFKTLKVLVK